MGSTRIHTTQPGGTAAKTRTSSPSSSSSSTERGSPPGDFDTPTLDALQNRDSCNVMDVVDSLRRGGLSSELQLPQLVVCGDQSSGKSSVLEAITEIPFPRKENLCTRFATQIIMRRSPVSSISTKIIPDKQRSVAEVQKLEQFDVTINDFTELPAVIEKATALMGLGIKPAGSSVIRAFSRDVLSIEITGPKRQPLTLVDLPGLFHSSTKMQSIQDKELVDDMVDDYIKEPRTIIMAVKVDPTGQRTMGIITKPDSLAPGSESEEEWLRLAQNIDDGDDPYHFQLGWHILKNRAYEEKDTSFEERNAAEKVFFSVGRYVELKREIVGIEALRARLGKILFKHLSAALPAMQKELNTKLLQVKNDLVKLGNKREGTHEQRRFLIGISESYQSIVRNAANGHYEHEFFGSLDTEAPITAESNKRRLRAGVQSLNEQFACLMRLYGRKTMIEDKATSKSRKREADQDLGYEYAPYAKRQKTVTLDVAMDNARRIIARSKGCELPGTFNPANISALLWVQSENWPELAQAHVDRVAELCESFVRTAIEYTMSADVADRMFDPTIDAALEARRNRAKAELTTLIKDNKRHPITYNPEYTRDVDRMRRKREEAQTKSQTKQVETMVMNARTGQQELVMRGEHTDNGEGSSLDHSRNKGAEDALDHEQAYYKREVDIFIANVTRQVVERHLLSNLAEETISPVLVSEMPDTENAYLTAEPDETAEKRNHLEARKTTLEKGHKTLRSALGRSR
ncbi:hypothetical protein LTR17_001558 [Elasticomyces elasticus]|nr:hypothetical protein LTR17_001558 [Elasticomyces elasticus]